jgi:thiamine kinase-like enzyme
MVISNINKLRLSQQAVKDGWKSAINDLIGTAGLTEINDLLIETRFTHTGWIGLFDLSDFESAIVIDIGLGGSIISLARRLKHVYAVYSDENMKIIFSERVKFFKLNNVTFIDAQAIEQIPKMDSNRLLVNVNDGSIKEQAKLTKKLSEQMGITRQIHLTYDKFFEPSYMNRLASKYFITGRLRAPFKVVSNKEKKSTLSFVLYLTYLVMSKIRGKAIIVTDAELEKSTLFKILLLVKQQLKLKKVPRVKCGYFVKPFGILLKILTGPTTSMLRVAFDELANERYGMAAKVMNKLRGVSQIIPEIILSGDYEGHPYQLESFFNGDNIESGFLQCANNRRVINTQAYDVLAKIHKSNPTKRRIDPIVYQRYFGSVIETVSGYFSSQTSSVFAEISQYVKNQLSGKNLLFVINHGDYSVDNLMIKDDVITGVIDWEFSLLEGLPLVDLFFYIISVRKKKNGTSLVKAMTEIYQLGGLDQEEQKLIDRYCAEFEISPSLVSSLAIMTIINFLFYRLDIKEEVDRKSIYDRNYLELVNSIGRYLQDVK